jgi:hypothetical protein
MKQALVFTYGKTKKHCKKYREDLNFQMEKLNIEENDYFYFTEKVTKKQFLNEVNDLIDESISCIFVNDYTEMLENKNEINDIVNELKKIGLDLFDDLEGNLTTKFTSVIKTNEQEEKLKRSIEAKEIRIKNVKEGKWTGGKEPFGYKLTVFKKLFVKEDEAKVVREIFHYYSRGARLMTVSRMIGDLYNCKYKNEYWKARKIYDILINPIYKGYYSFNKNKKINGKMIALPKEEWELSENKDVEIAIVDELLFEKVQGMLENDTDKPAYHSKKNV